MLVWSARALAAAQGIDRIVVAVPPGREDEASRLLAAAEIVARVISGGASRADSVARALAICEGELICIHDAARPAVSAVAIDAVIARLRGASEADAAILAAPILDTVKLAASGCEAGSVVIERTLDRARLWAAQTPQVFRRKALAAAQAMARQGGRLETATDEAMLIELAGGTIVIEPSDPSNLKVTTPADLRIAAAQLIRPG